APALGEMQDDGCNILLLVLSDICTRCGGRFVDGGPAIGRAQEFRVIDEADDAGLAYRSGYYLVDRYPGDIIDQFLLGFVVLLKTRELILIDVGLLHCLLGLLL